MRRNLGMVLAAFLAASVLPLSGAAEPPLVGSLGLGDSVFWSGGYVGWSPAYSLPGSPSNEALDRCSAPAGPCFEFRLETTATASLLRVALDTPQRDDGFEWVVLDPAGVRRARVTNTNHYTREALIQNPPVGVWTIRVAPFAADQAPFRMRAQLSNGVPPPVPDANAELRPNLRVFRMWEFGFAPPGRNNGTFPGDDENPPAGIAGVHPVTCAADEIVEDGARRCLRYSFGLANAGEGNFDIRFTRDMTGEPQPMTQCVQKSDGTVYARAAGTGRFHASHSHWHYDDIIFHQLFKVTDATTGAMTAVGTGKKLGYSPADQGMVEWSRFQQNAPNTSGLAGNCTTGTNARLGMSRGWGDAYRYQRPGNYVEFGDNGSGLYVVRTTADPLDLVLESDETDNTAYAYLSITFDELGRESIDILESGIGAGPWDAGKIVIDEWYQYPETVQLWPTQP